MDDNSDGIWTLVWVITPAAVLILVFATVGAVGLNMVDSPLTSDPSELDRTVTSNPHLVTGVSDSERDSTLICSDDEARVTASRIELSTNASTERLVRDLVVVYPGGAGSKTYNLSYGEYAVDPVCLIPGENHIILRRHETGWTEERVVVEVEIDD